MSWIRTVEVSAGIYRVMIGDAETMMVWEGTNSAEAEQARRRLRRIIDERFAARAEQVYREQVQMLMGLIAQYADDGLAEIVGRATGWAPYKLIAGEFLWCESCQERVHPADIEDGKHRGGACGGYEVKTVGEDGLAGVISVHCPTCDSARDFLQLVTSFDGDESRFVYKCGICQTVLDVDLLTEG